MQRAFPESRDHSMLMDGQAMSEAEYSLTAMVYSAH